MQQNTINKLPWRGKAPAPLSATEELTDVVLFDLAFDALDPSNTDLTPRAGLLLIQHLTGLCAELIARRATHPRELLALQARVSTECLRDLATRDGDRQINGLTSADRAMLLVILPDMAGELLARRAHARALA